MNMFFCVLFIFVWVIPIIIEWIQSVDWMGKLDNPANNPYYIPPHNEGYDYYKKK